MMSARFLTAAVALLSIPAAMGLAAGGTLTVEEALSSTTRIPVCIDAAAIAPAGLRFESVAPVRARRTGVPI